MEIIAGERLTNPRARIARAATELFAAVGYHRVRPEAIAAAAGVPPETFYLHFEDKEECFLACLDECVEAAEEFVGERVARIEPWADRIAAGLAACLEAVAADPAAARLCLIEAPTAGQAAASRRLSLDDRIEAQLRQGRAVSALGETLPNELEPFLTNALTWLVQQHLREDRVEALAALQPEMLELVLSYLDGQERTGAGATKSRLDE